MSVKAAWDWEPGKKTIADTSKCGEEIGWREESQASPDGEQIAAVVNVGEGEFTVCVNEQLWENVFERVWYLRYAPTGKLTGLVVNEMEPTLAVDDEPLEESFGFIWETKFAGDSIAAAVQNDMEYGMLLNGQVWETLYGNANNFVLSPSGRKTAACVQVEDMAQAEIYKFQEGIFSVAVDGQAWDSKFVNTWTPVFSADDKHVAAQVRKDLYTYSIAIDGKSWTKDFGMVWEPCFNPKSGAVAAPVRVSGKWGMAQDGNMIWNASYNQVWQQQYSADGSILAAIVSPVYGKWTVAIDNKPWSIAANRMLADLTVSDNGKIIAALGKDTQDQWTVMVNGQAWSNSYDMAWAPVISSDEGHVGVKVEKDGKYTIVIDNKEYDQEFAMVWDPVFSAGSTKVMIRALDSDGKYHRIIEPLSKFTG